MAKEIYTQELTSERFAPYGDVITVSDDPDAMINEGRCQLFRDRAHLAFGTGRAGINVFQSATVDIPYNLTFMERHPLGSQAFIPMTPKPFLVIVADNVNEKPTNIQAFITKPYQAINFHQNVWHGALAPLSDPAMFVVVDRVGEEENLEIYSFDEIFYINIK